MSRRQVGDGWRGIDEGQWGSLCLKWFELKSAPENEFNTPYARITMNENTLYSLTFLIIALQHKDVRGEGVGGVGGRGYVDRHSLQFA